MKTYRICFASGPLATLGMLVVITFLSLTVIALPIAIALLPTLYRIEEEPDSFVDN